MFEELKTANSEKISPAAIENFPIENQFLMQRGFAKFVVN
jgi:hypothetical protein